MPPSAADINPTDAQQPPKLKKKETKAKIKLIKLDLYCAKSYFLFNLAYFPLMEPLAIRRMEALKITDCPRMTLVV